MTECRLKIAPVFRRNIRPSNKDTPNLLLKLPSELRNQIYELVLPQSTVVTIAKGANTKEPPLLQTCKQIRQESSSTYYANNEIHVVIDLETNLMERVALKLDAIVLTCGPKPF